MRYFPEKLTCKWIKQAYENGLMPSELMEEIIRRAEKKKEANVWIVQPSLSFIQSYLDALPEEKEGKPLWGIPFAVKDNIDVKGLPTTAACPEYAYQPKKHAFVVEKLIAAGAIPVGKTNLDQFATGLVGTRSPYGEVHNAYQPELISGGSSSGSAVSVALGMAAFSLGTDTAGSGRVPAMLNTLVGYKPPLGAWSASGVVPACASLDCVTVFAHNLEEAELVNEIARGYDADYPYSRKFEHVQEENFMYVKLPVTEEAKQSETENGEKFTYVKLPVAGKANQSETENGENFTNVKFSAAETINQREINVGKNLTCAGNNAVRYKLPKALPQRVYLPQKEPRFYGNYAEIYRRKWQRAVKRIEELGIPVEHIDYSMFEKAALILYEGAYVAERWQDLKEFVESHPGKVFPVTETILRSGAKPENTAAKLFENLHDLQSYRHKTEQLLKNSVMIMPTAGGTFTRDEVRENPIETNSLMGLYTNHCNLLDLMAVAIPENSTDREYPFGITVFGLHEAESQVTALAERFLETETMPIAVCGLHRQGGALEYQLTELGAVWEKRTCTAPEYRLYRLNTTPAKPGLVHVDSSVQGERAGNTASIKQQSLHESSPSQGQAIENGIEVDVYRIPKYQFGRFLEQVSKPLTIGDIKLEDGSIVKGFLCESIAAVGAEDITAQGKFVE